jgi:hypothetical protein
VEEAQVPHSVSGGCRDLPGPLVCCPKPSRLPLRFAARLADSQKKRQEEVAKIVESRKAREDYSIDMFTSRPDIKTKSTAYQQRFYRNPTRKNRDVNSSRQLASQSTESCIWC